MPARLGRGVLAWGMVSALLVAACGGPARETAAPGKAAEGETIKIGGLWAMTGVLQSFGKNSSAVFRMAIDEINAKGGVELADGRRVLLEGTIYDEGCPQAEVGIAATRKAAGDPVLVVIGPTCSTTAEPVYGILQKHLDDPGDTGLQLPLFTDTAIKGFLAQLSPWAFRNTPSELEMYDELFRWLKETTGLSTVGVGTEFDFAHSKSTSEGAIKPGAQGSGFKLVADEGWKLADTDFSTQAARIREANPDVVVLASHPFTTCGFLKELNRQGFKPKALVALTSSITTETLEGCGRDAQGMIGPTSFAPVTDRGIALSKKVSEEYKGFLDLNSAAVYENVMLLKGVFKAAGVEGRPDTLQQDRRRIRDQLEKVTEFDGLLGKITFRHDLGGEVEKPWVIAEVKEDRWVVKEVPAKFKDAVK